MQFWRKREIEVRVLKESNLFLGEKSDPLISCAFVTIKLYFKLFPQGEINNFSHHPLATLLRSLGCNYFSIFPDSILIAIKPGEEIEPIVKKLIPILLALKEGA